jgi:adenine-specific DNA-methyltransferase
MPNALDTYINHIGDENLREAITGEVTKLRQNKRYGLVFDEHLPETILLHKRRPRLRDTVIRKGDEEQVIHSVTKVVNTRRVRIRPDGGGDEFDARISDLTVIKRFGEPIYPALSPVHRVQRSDDPKRPRHTIINADNYHALQLLLYTHEGQVDVIYIDPPYNTGARDWKYNNRYVDKNDSWRHSK